MDLGTKAQTQKKNTNYVEGEGEMPILVLLSLELGIRERLSCVLLVCAIGVQEIM